MKKFVKLSLVAAVAVAGLTTANADNLVASIKTVEAKTITYQQQKNSDLQLFAVTDFGAPSGGVITQNDNSKDIEIHSVAAFGGQKLMPDLLAKQDDYCIVIAAKIAQIGCDIAGGTAHSLVAGSSLGTA